MHIQKNHFKIPQTFYPFIFIFLILNSCTTSSENSIAASQDSDIYYVSERVRDLCLDSDDPQFLTQFSSLNSSTSFQLEGVWKNNYTLLNMQVLGAFGEQYAYFELNNHQIKVFSMRQNILEDEKIKNLIHIVSSLGPIQLRNLFCGSYALQNDKKNEVFYLKNDPRYIKDTYSTKSTLNIDDHTLDVQSDFILENSTNNKGYNLTINSQFLYGIFSSNSNFNVEWIGYVDDEQVSPKLINFNYEKDNYEFKILDYN